MYVTRGMEGGHAKCIQVRTGEEGHNASCVRTHLHALLTSLFMFLPYGVFFICRNLILASFKKGVFIRNGYFSPMKLISVVMK